MRSFYLKIPLFFYDTMLFQREMVSKALLFGRFSFDLSFSLAESFDSWGVAFASLVLHLDGHFCSVLYGYTSPSMYVFSQ